MQVVKESDERLQGMIQALLETGGTLIFPTDTVYGIGGGPWDERTLAQVRRMKGRVVSQPFTLHLPSIEAIERFAHVDECMQRVLARFLPGPITFILPATKDAPPATVLKGNVGIRVPAHPFFQLTMRELDRPLFGTSVNRAGEAPLHSIEMMIEQFSGVDLLVEGETCTGVPPGTGVPSAIVDLTTDPPQALRGKLPKDLM
ncbi:MAG: L-threonylcarbamoyladenylate synthase [Candidatus Bipolaricaulota bacterium]|nr:L-threonylcarbamoyladenylate synthase [Candidatus Bipolaricaulota bacterium]